MTPQELIALLDAGAKPVVRFSKGIEDQEGYLDVGMMGRLTHIVKKHDDGDFTVFVELSSFDEFNRQFETANYYDESGSACLTAREAGYYKGSETIYISIEGEIDFFVIQSDESRKLMTQYQESGSTVGYVQWLEEKVIALSTGKK